MLKKIVCTICLVMSGCGVYTFSGSALPSHIKTVAIPLFENTSLEPGIAEEMTRIITKEYISNGALRVVEKKPHASLNVTITGYTSEAHNYNAQGDVREYRIIIKAAAVFRDEIKGKDIWKEDNIICSGNYSSEAGSSETEETGKERAMQDLARILIENTISGW